MSNSIEVLISVVVVLSLTLLLSRTLKLSTKYERKPRKLSDWNAQDQGIDPTLEVDPGSENESDR